MNTTDFASELGTDTRTARKFLRSITPKEDQPGKGSRWDITEGKREITKMKKQFIDWKTAQEKAAEEAAEAEVNSDKE